MAAAGMEAALQKLVLRQKKVLSAEELELFELAQAAGCAIDPDVFKVLLDLLKLNVAPLAVFQMLKAMCAGHRLASEPPDPAAAPDSRAAVLRSPPARPSFSSAPRPAASLAPQHGPAAASCCLFSPFAGRNRGSTTLGGGSVLTERSGREGSGQRMPRQPSATRLPKGAGPGKSPPRSST